MDNRTAYAYIAAAVSAIIFGLDFVVLKYLMPQYITPKALVGLRTVVAAIVFFVISLFVKIRKVDKIDLIIIALTAILGLAIRFIIYFTGLSKTSAIDGSIIMVGVPVIVLILSVIFLHEKLTVGKVTGVLFGLVGSVILVSYGHKFSGSSASAEGNVMVFASALMLAGYNIIVKKYIGKYGSFTLTFYIFIFASLMIIPLTAKEIFETNWQALNLKHWLLICYVVIIVTVIGYFLNTFSLQNLKVTTVTSFSYLQPVVAVTFSYIFLHDKLNIMQLICAILIIFGGFLVVKSGKK